VIHPLDAAAIRAAREQGVLVTISTGRLTSRTHPIARALDLDGPLICADGGVLACAATQRILRRRAVHQDVVEPVLAAFADAAIASFLFTHDSIHCCERGRDHQAYVQGWANSVTTHADVRAAQFWRQEADAPIMLVGIGDSSSIDAVLTALEPHRALLDAGTFDSSRGRVVRVMAQGASKGAALAELAAELGIGSQDIAVAGDFWNDLSMFAFAGRSFAMGHAPDPVKAAATHVLTDRYLAAARLPMRCNNGSVSSHKPGVPPQRLVLECRLWHPPTPQLHAVR
jgi:Cof subfamily protein (haloacid dehalogenase superfamily)